MGPGRVVIALGGDTHSAQDRSTRLFFHAEAVRADPRNARCRHGARSGILLQLFVPNRLSRR